MNSSKDARPQVSALREAIEKLKAQEPTQATVAPPKREVDK